MKVFLTSNSGGFGRINGERIGCEFNRANGFADMLKEKLPYDVRCLFISSSPDKDFYELNDSIARNLKDGFTIDGYNVKCVDVCDNRNANDIANYIHNYNVLFLTGGHVPTQNKFFQDIHLKTLLKNYEGIIIGRSAGAMNCADVVYAQQELEGEATNPNYKKYLDGLGLTNICILPHFEFLRGNSIDGLDIVKDICLPDSRIRPFYALTNNSFIYIHEGHSILYGEAYLFRNGDFSKIFDDGMSVTIL
jgi:peptidase E